MDVSSIAWLIGATLIILASSELFTNGVEWLGHKLNLGEGAVGTVLAAAGTALPEVIIGFVALVIYQNGVGHEDIGVGAILGAPFTLGTAAYGVLGIVALTTRRHNRPVHVAVHEVKNDLLFFLVIFIIGLGCAFISSRVGLEVRISAKVAVFIPVKLVIAIGFVIAWIIYTVKRLDSEGHDGKAPRRLHFSISRRERPRLWEVLLQLVVAVIGMGTGANQFVAHIQPLAAMLGLPFMATSLVLSPIASELPECITVFLWTRRGRDQLAFGNVAGSMVIQCCLPVATGLAFSNWRLDSSTWVASACAFAGVTQILLWLYFAKHLRPAVLLINVALYLGVWGLVLAHVIH